MTASSITELKTTLFLTPVLSTVCRWLSRLIIKLIGWRIEGEPPQDKKYIIIAAPHTSNWDFGLFLLVAFIKRLDLHWMGKDALFPRPLKGLMIWLGGIPIDRSKANNVVDQMVQYFASVDQLGVLIPPEGTRSKVDRWKTGFYHIAHQAELPIFLAYIDARTKTIGFGRRFQPTGDIEKELAEIQSFYHDKQGLVPENG